MNTPRNTRRTSPLRTDSESSDSYIEPDEISPRHPNDDENFHLTLQNLLFWNNVKSFLFFHYWQWQWFRIVEIELFL